MPSKLLVVKELRFAKELCVKFNGSPQIQASRWQLEGRSDTMTRHSAYDWLRRAWHARCGGRCRRPRPACALFNTASKVSVFSRMLQ